jgi:glucose-6-phosphate-specific signal transduction histidine kinase
MPVDFQISGKVLNMNKLINVIVVVSCVVLGGSYFLPTEMSWSPLDAWQGYYVGDELVKDFNMALVETFPFGVGVVVLVGLALSRRPTASAALFVVFAAGWAISLALEVARIVRNPHYEFPMLWLMLAVSIIPAAIVVIILILRKYQGMSTTLILGAVLAASSILQQSCLIAWYLLEDKLLLNVGSVTGMAGGAVLFVGLLVKKEAFGRIRASKRQDAEPISALSRSRV